MDNNNQNRPQVAEQKDAKVRQIEQIWKYQNPHHIGVTDAATRSNMENLGDLVKHLTCYASSWSQSAPDVDIEYFSGKMHEYHYFYALFREVIESKIEKPKRKLIRFIKYTAGDAREPIKHCNQQPYHKQISLDPD